MANPNTPFGLHPLMRTLSGGFPEVLHMLKATADVVYPQDAVNQLADATIEADSATPGTTLFSGIALGYGAAAAANVKIPVVVSPDALFSIQSSGDFQVADGGLNANLVLTAGDSTLTRSKHACNIATKAVTATLDIKLRRLMPIMGNVVGNYAIIEATWQNHRNAPAAAGV